MIDWFKRSMTARLALAFALALTVLVGASGFYLYASIEHILFTQIHQDFINTANLLLHKLDEDRLPLDKEILDVGDHFTVRITDLAGRTVLETQGMDKRLPPGCLPKTSGSWIWSDQLRTKEHSFRVLAARHSRGWLQIARDLKPDEDLLREFHHSILALLAASPFLGAACGYWLVRLGLRPLQLLEREAEHIRPESLEIRIDASSLPMELSPLSQALNHSLGRLETAFRQLRQLNSDLAHELRTPVHSLRLEAEAILDRGGLAEGVEDQLAGMMDTLDHLADLIEQMLFLARSEDPANEVAMAPLSASGLLRTAMAPFESLAEENQISLEMSAPEGLSLRGNATLLRRAIHNLLDNAIRHSRAHGTVTLRAVPAPGRVSLEVEDRGEGIPSEMLERLGQRFVRADASRSRKRGGAGLGLAIVQGIAKLHGGSFQISSREGVGTVAKVTIPAA